MSPCRHMTAAMAAALALAGQPSAAVAAERLMLVVQARGVHHWVCSADGDANHFGWQLQALDVELLEADGRPAKRLGLAPRWRMSDGTQLRGLVQPASDVPQRKDLPWLELHAKGPHGSASRVAQAMRFAPDAADRVAQPCSGGQRGMRAQAPWTGEYYFFAPA
jgi:Protein of unknown function (DUF3455)